MTTKPERYLNDKLLIARGGDYPEYYLKPGYLYVTQVPTCVVTVLGSCVSVCLTDVRNRYGGINHYQLPEPFPLEPESTKFGSTSIRKLIESFLEFGSNREDLRARVLGGAAMSGNHQSRQVADLNIEIANRLLAENNISIYARDTGGTMGRKIWFYTDTGELTLSLLMSERDLDREYFKEDLALQL
ncbi:MAG: chemotaxis protein CheD [Spirochaetales bacterium]|nr:chemotaxis protein CheD [Spirochaetales bacterium]